MALAGSVAHCKSFRRWSTHVHCRPNDLNSADYGDDGCQHTCSSDSAELLFLIWPVLAPSGDSQASWPSVAPALTAHSAAGPFIIAEPI